MEITRNIDWMEELKENFDYWTNHGRNALEDSCKHTDQDNGNETNMRYSGYCSDSDISESSAQPMMNYGYPLRTLPDDENILKIVRETNLTVMENPKTEEVYLVLCGGGMDLSQDIALGYLLAGARIPDELCFEVCTQPCLSVSKKNYLKIMREVRKELKNIQSRAQWRLKEINQTVRGFKLREKAKVTK